MGINESYVKIFEFLTAYVFNWKKWSKAGRGHMFWLKIWGLLGLLFSYSAMGSNFFWNPQFSDFHFWILLLNNKFGCVGSTFLKTKTILSLNSRIHGIWIFFDIDFWYYFRYVIACIYRRSVNKVEPPIWKEWAHFYKDVLSKVIPTQKDSKQSLEEAKLRYNTLYRYIFFI